MKKQHGFTIIELLLVIGMIGILAGVLVSVINPTILRARARDTQRISDLKKVQVALELYFSDNIAYPLTANYSSLQTLDYIDILPRDPSTNVNYYYNSVGSTYTLVAQLELSEQANSNCYASGYSNCYGLTSP